MDCLKWAIPGSKDLTGKVVIALGALVVLAMIILSCRGFAEIKTFDFSRRGQDASLALVRSDCFLVRRSSGVEFHLQNR